MYAERRPEPFEGRPSASAQGRLAVGMRHELACSRMAWEAALLRGDAAVAERDAVEVAAALDEQRALLVDLESRVGDLVAAAAAEREAEMVVSAASGAATAPIPRRQRTWLHRAPAVLAGAAAALVAFAVAVTLGPGAPGVPDIATVPGTSSSDRDFRPELTGRLDGVTGAEVRGDQGAGHGADLPPFDPPGVAHPTGGTPDTVGTAEAAPPGAEPAGEPDPPGAPSDQPPPPDLGLPDVRLDWLDPRLPDDEDEGDGIDADTDAPTVLPIPSADGVDPLAGPGDDDRDSPDATGSSLP